MAVEWARLRPDAVVVATPDQVWLHTPNPLGDPFARPMTGAGRVDTTRRLLDGAVFAGMSAEQGSRETPPLTPSRWAWRLIGYYHTTRVTPPFLAQAAQRFRAQGRTALSDWAEDRAQHERGHDALALRDLEAMGYDAESVVAAYVPETAANLVELFMEWVGRPDPVACVGYAYALERMALRYDGEYVRSVQAILPPSVDATRCLRVHSSAGADTVHVAENVALVACLAADERTAIAQAAYRTATIAARPASTEGDWDGAVSNRRTGRTD